MKLDQLLETLGEPQNETELRIYKDLQAGSPVDFEPLICELINPDLEYAAVSLPDDNYYVYVYLVITLLRLDEYLSRQARLNIKPNDFALILSLVNGIVKTLGKDFPKKVPKGDAGLYLVARLLVTRLEERNPGIAESVGLNPVAE